VNLKGGQRRKKTSERREEGRQKNAQPHPDTPSDQMWRVEGGVEGARSSSSSQIGIDTRVGVKISL
jgi:hypothetical protein